MFNYGEKCVFIIYIHIITICNYGKYTLFSIKVENLSFLFVFF
jgi:hypothetical protein